MSPGARAHPIPKVVVLGTLELGLLPFRLAARLIGGFLLAAAAIGVPAWLIQLAISLAGGGSGGGPLPAWAMALTLTTLVPGGMLAMRLASIPGPLRRNPTIRREAIPDWGSADRWTETDDGFDSTSDEPPTTSDVGTTAWAYQALDLSPTATPAEIKAAYRRLAHVYHPDHNPGFSREATEHFTTIHRAYEILLGTVSTPA